MNENIKSENTETIGIGKIKRRVGRPGVNISWPSSPFTLNNLKETSGDVISRAGLQLKLTKAIKEHKIVCTGIVKGKGRPQKLYVKNSETVSA